jgi:hypothetical protein
MRNLTVRESDDIHAAVARYGQFLDVPVSTSLRSC